MTEEVHNVFLITSVVNARHSAISQQQRITETLESIASVKTQYPTCSIILIEGSNHVWDVRELENTNTTIVYHDVSKHHKSVGEAKLLLAALQSEEFKRIKEQHQALRVFKLSARYTLTDRFNKNVHEDPEKITLLQQPSQTRHGMYVTVTVLYSVPSNLLELYNNSLTRAIDAISSQNLDIEHMLFHNVDATYFNTVPILGVRGRIAPTGAEWSA